MTYIIKRIRELKNPLRIAGKICLWLGRQLRHGYNRLRIRWFGSTLPDRAFLRSAFKRPWPGSAELARHFRERATPRFWFNPASLRAGLEAAVQLDPELQPQILASAARLMEHRFNLLGSGEVQLGAEIDWHTDFKTGYRWDPKVYYFDVPRPYGTADIKVPWELSRFQHLSTLGWAYALSSKPEYPEEFVRQIEHWIAHNPPECGVNWHCAMDVAIRACNWILAFYCFQDSPALSDGFMLRFLKSLYQHGIHLKANLERGGANHYLADLAGLAYLGIIFPEFKAAAGWRNFALAELRRETGVQLLKDGVDFEGSSCYHRLSLELWFFPAWLAVLNAPGDRPGDDFPAACARICGPEYPERLRQAFKAVRYLLKPDGRMPQIGDNDSGRLHLFMERDSLDMRYLLNLGAVCFKEPDFKIPEFGFCPEALWILGSGSRELWEALPGATLEQLGSKAFPKAGWYVMREGGNYCIASCGSKTSGAPTGHCHNDGLSFELQLQGRDIVVDPGSYVYTSKPVWRNRFRSTYAHNTVVIDGREQNPFDSRQLFWLERAAGTRVESWDPQTETDTLIASHDGYDRLENPVIHKREFRFDKRRGSLELIDSFSGSGWHTLEWNFTLAPGICREVKLESDRLSFAPRLGHYSPEYGGMTETPCLSARMETEIPGSLSVRIVLSYAP